MSVGTYLLADRLALATSIGIIFALVSSVSNFAPKLQKLKSKKNSFLIDIISGFNTISNDLYLYFQIVYFHIFEKLYFNAINYTLFINVYLSEFLFYYLNFSGFIYLTGYQAAKNPITITVSKTIERSKKFNTTG